jgi:hypothetical protein
LGFVSKIPLLLWDRFRIVPMTSTYKTWIWVWMIALLSASVGISVHRIYCYCIGESRLSLFSESDPCSENDEIADCCQSTPEKSCCEKPAIQKRHQETPCTKKTTEVFQMKTEFIVEYPFEKTFDYPLWIPDFPFYKRILRPIVCDARYGNKAPPESPPPIFGRDLCIRHELFLC